MAKTMTPTIDAVISAIKVMQDRPSAISISPRTSYLLQSEAHGLGMVYDSSCTRNTILGVPWFVSRKDDSWRGCIDIRDLDGVLLMRVARDG
jgi:hypothetical protein